MSAARAPRRLAAARGLAGVGRALSKSAAGRERLSGRAVVVLTSVWLVCVRARRRRSPPRPPPPFRSVASQRSGRVRRPRLRSLTSHPSASRLVATTMTAREREPAGAHASSARTSMRWRRAAALGPLRDAHDPSAGRYGVQDERGDDARHREPRERLAVVGGQERERDVGGRDGEQDEHGPLHSCHEATETKTGRVLKRRCASAASLSVLPASRACLGRTHGLVRIAGPTCAAASGDLQRAVPPAAEPAAALRLRRRCRCRLAATAPQRTAAGGRAWRGWAADTGRY